MRKMMMVVSLLTAAAFIAGPAFAADDKEYKKQEKQASMSQGQSGKPMAIEQFKGMAVKSGQGEELGNIEQIYVDTQKGKIAYVVLAAGGVLGVGEEKYLVPFKALDTQARKDEITLNMDTQKLKQAPQFAEQKLEDKQFERKVHDFFGVSPYWSEEGGQQQQKMQHQQDMDKQQKQMEQQRQQGMEQEKKRY